MIRIDGEKESGNSVLSVRHDDISVKTFFSAVQAPQFSDTLIWPGDFISTES